MNIVISNRNPSTCYWVNLGSGNFSDAAFDARGSIFSEERARRSWFYAEVAAL